MYALSTFKAGKQNEKLSVGEKKKKTEAKRKEENNNNNKKWV